MEAINQLSAKSHINLIQSVSVARELRESLASEAGARETSVVLKVNASMLQQLQTSLSELQVVVLDSTLNSIPAETMQRVAQVAVHLHDELTAVMSIEEVATLQPIELASERTLLKVAKEAQNEPLQQSIICLHHDPVDQIVVSEIVQPQVSTEEEFSVISSKQADQYESVNHETAEVTTAVGPMSCDQVTVQINQPLTLENINVFEIRLEESNVPMTAETEPATEEVAAEASPLKPLQFSIDTVSNLQDTSTRDKLPATSFGMDLVIEFNVVSLINQLNLKNYILSNQIGTKLYFNALLAFLFFITNDYF